MSMELILHLQFGLIVLLAGLNLWLWERRKRRRGLCQCRAVILSRRKEMRTLQTSGGSVDYDWHYVTFRLADGSMLLLSVSEAVWSLPPGTAGSLIHGDGRCESFIPD